MPEFFLSIWIDFLPYWQLQKIKDDLKNPAYPYHLSSAFFKPRWHIHGTYAIPVSPLT